MNFPLNKVHPKQWTKTVQNNCSFSITVLIVELHLRNRKPIDIFKIWHEQRIINQLTVNSSPGLHGLHSWTWLIGWSNVPDSAQRKYSRPFLDLDLLHTLHMLQTYSALPIWIRASFSDSSIVKNSLKN